MFDWIDIVNNSLRNLVTGLEPGQLSGDQAALLVQKLAEVERLAAAGKALAAARVDESNRWRRDGHRSAAHWMAAQTGSSVRGAMEAIDTAKRVTKLPQVEEAFRTGQLSAAQAGEISAAATVSPQSEHDLLNAAKTETLSGLRERCRRTRHAALPDEAARHEAIRLSRYFRPRSTPDGAFEASMRGTSVDGARLMAALERFQKQVFDNARRTGTREPYEAYAFDALIAMAESRTRTTQPTNDPAPAPAPAPSSTSAPPPPPPPTSTPPTPPAPPPTSTPTSPSSPSSSSPSPASALSSTSAATAARSKEGSGGSTSATAPSSNGDRTGAPITSNPGPKRSHDARPDTELFPGQGTTLEAGTIPAGTNRSSTRPPSTGSAPEHTSPSPSGSRARPERSTTDPPASRPTPPPVIPDGPTAMIHVRVDLSALRRGHSVDGEMCEIPGVGPIPVATARMLAADSIINVLLVDGVDVTRIAHTGRTVTAHQRSALRERSSTCEVPGCDARHNLEIDHNDPWALSKNTSLANVNLLCRWHHYQKTHCGHRLTGPPGDRQWHTPSSAN